MFFMELVIKTVKEVRYKVIYLRLKYFLQNGENFGPSKSRLSYNSLVPVVEKTINFR